MLKLARRAYVAGAIGTGVYVGRQSIIARAHTGESLSPLYIDLASVVLWPVTVISIVRGPKRLTSGKR